MFKCPYVKLLQFSLAGSCSYIKKQFKVVTASQCPLKSQSRIKVLPNNPSTLQLHKRRLDILLFHFLVELQTDSLMNYGRWPFLIVLLRRVNEGRSQNRQQKRTNANSGKGCSSRKPSASLILTVWSQKRRYCCYNRGLWIFKQTQCINTVCI